MAKKLEIQNVFDEVYTDFCNKLRETGKASSVCESIKNCKTDLNRISILNKKHNIVPTLAATVKKCMRNNSKDATQARELLDLYYLKNDTSSEIDNESLRLLNYAVSCVQIDNEISIEQFDDFEKDEVDFIKNLLVDNSELNGNIVSNIYRERADFFCKVASYEMCLIEALRGIFYAKINKNNPNEYLFSLLFLIITSLKHLSKLEAATNVLQFSIKLLRIAGFDNAVKSQEIVKLVKLMKDIQLLSKKGEENKEKMNLRTFMEPKNENIPKIFDSNSNILVNASSCLQLNWQADRGRHIIATKTIPLGSTIIVERPYSWVLHPNMSHTYCQDCCHRVENAIPCNKCTSVIFCSKHCQKAAVAYHQFECEFMTNLNTSEILGDMALICYRTITKTNEKNLEAHIRDYLKFEEVNGNNPAEKKKFHDKYILGLDMVGKLDSNCYISVFAQTPNSEYRFGGDLLKRSFSAIVLTLCLRFTGYFETSNSHDVENNNLSDKEELFASLFLRHLQSASCNAYGITSKSGNDPRRINEIGGATYPVISTTNHSCNSNIYRFTVGKTCIVKTLREIKFGEEILDSYSSTFAANSIDERVRHLHEQYLFTCCCSPCNENWLVFSKLPRYNPCFKCSRCKKESSINRKGKHFCNKCGNVFNMKDIMKTAKGWEKQLQSTKDLILNPKNNGKAIDYAAIEHSIVKFGIELEQTQNWPCQVLIECQETLKLCWNVESRTSRSMTKCKYEQDI